MKIFAVLVFMLLSANICLSTESGSPIEKILDMMADLKSEVSAEQEKEQAIYDKTAALCAEKIATTGFLIKEGKKEIGELKATIEKETSIAESLTSKIEELSAVIAKKESELKEATALRVKGAGEYEAELKELSDIIDTLQRAITVLERSSGASMLQLKGAHSVVEALGVMVQASMLNSADAQRLTVLLQSSQSDEDSDEVSEDSVGAPAAVYQSKSGGITETLSDMLDKAEDQRDDAQKQETKSIHEFKLMEASLKDAIKFAKKEMAETKQALAESAEKKGVAEGDLAVTIKALESNQKTKEVTEKECLDAATTFEDESKKRQEEIKAVTEAMKVVKEATSAALNQVSFLQVRVSSGVRSSGNTGFEVVSLVQSLGRKHKSAALMKLAMRIASTVRRSAGRNGDPFKKVKQLISDMITQLEDEGDKAADKKAFCDKEMSDSEASKTDKEDQIEAISTKLDSANAALGQLKSEVADIEKSLAAMESEQMEEAKIRQAAHEQYLESIAEQEKALKGVKLALKILGEYYSKDAGADSTGAGSSIISLLEVVESDLTQSLAELEAGEQTAASDFEASTLQFKTESARMKEDVKYKEREAAKLASAISELEADGESLQAALASVVEYLDKIKKKCVAQPDTFAQRIEKLEAEIAGLKDALQILQQDAMLLQRSTSHRRALRGVLKH